MAPPTPVTTKTNTTPATPPPADPKKAPEKKDDKKTAAPASGKTTVTYEKADDKFVLRPFFNWGLGKVGGPNGTLFSIDSNPANEHGDWNIYRLGVDGEFRVARMFKDKASLLLGATLSADFHRGGQNTGGSYLNAVEFGPSVTLDWTNAYNPAWKVIGPNRVTLQGGLLAGKGNTTAGDNFSLDDTSGAGGFLRGAVDLLAFRLTPSGTTLNVGAWFETGVIPDARGSANYPYYAGGVGISIPIRWPGATKKVTTEICTTSETALEDLKRDLPIMRKAVGEAYADYTTLSDVLKSKGYDSDTVRKYLRAGRIEQLKAQETARVEAEGQAAGKKADEIKKDVAAALKAKEKDFLTTAEVDYPDGFDYYNVKLPKQANIPDPLPTDCNAIEDLRKQLEDEKRGLDKAAQVIYDKMHFMLMLLGVPKGASTTVVKLIRSVTRIRDVHFITNTPWGKDDPYTKKSKKKEEATIEYLNAVVDAYLKTKAADADGNREPLPMADMMKTFGAIFPSSYKPDKTKFNPALDAIAEVATTFRSSEFKGFKVYIIGNTDSRGDAEYNMRLSLRRAEAITDALKLQGVRPEMLIPIGRGETNLIYYYDQRKGKEKDHVISKVEIKELAANGIKGTALSEEIVGRQTTNRRVEVIVCAPNSDDSLCQALEKETAPVAPGTQPTTPADAPVQSIETEKKKVTKVKKENPPPPPPEKTPPPPPPPPPPAPDIR